MVWKSPRRQHGRGNTSEASSISSQPLLSSPAEIQVREIASRIGLFEDSEILATVCQKMRKEYIVEEWQLPALDSRQWEKMHAPIGLAAAVKHVSTHRLREQEMQFPFRDRSFNDNRQGYGEKGESLRVLAGGDNLLSSSFEEDTALITTSSSWSSKEEEDKAEIEIVDKSKSDDHPVVRSKEVFVKMEDEPNEIKILTSTNEKEQDDDLKIKKTFSADCADWLKLVVATEKDEEDEVARKEQQRGSRASSVFRRVKNDSGDDNNGAIEPMMKRKSSSKMVEVAQGNIEPANGIVSKTHRSVEDKRAETYVETEPFDTLERGKSTSSAQDVIEPSKNVERGIPAGNEKNLEPAQFQIESFRGMEQGGLIPPAEAEREQEVSQTGANSTESTESECVTVPKDNQQNEMSLVGSDNRDGIESATTSIHVQTNVENDLGNSQTEGLPEMNSSDSESDENTNIFSGIANTASFSEDEDDNRIPDKDAALLDRLLDPLEHTEDSVLSSMSDPETNLLLFSDYGADDITVAVSNVSPECKKAASQRKKKMNKYRYEYDRGKYSICSYASETP